MSSASSTRFDDGGSAAVPVMRFHLWDIPKVFWRMALFCDDRTIFSLMVVNKRFYVLSTHDNVWREILVSYNLQALISFPISKSLYRYFFEDVLTTRALHGRYDFEAHTSTSDRMSAYNINSAVLIASSATLGLETHSIGRAQLMITYRSGSVEVLQGCLRFSGVRRCFLFCSSVFGSPVRGPVFTVAVAQVKRKWANQSPTSLSLHQGGIRLVMTPVLTEGKSKGSLINETDIVAVSRPPPDAAAVTAAAAAAARAAVDL